MSGTTALGRGLFDLPWEKFWINPEDQRHKIRLEVRPLFGNFFLGFWGLYLEVN